MIKQLKLFVAVLITAMTVFLSIGYAAVSDNISIKGSAEASPAYDVYISDITQKTGASVEINNYFHTVMSSKVIASGTSTFSVTVTNVSNKVYVFERVIDGAEINIDGIYNGSDITYTITALSPLQEINPWQSITFNLSIQNPKNIRTDNFYLNFNFIEKTGTEILPGTDPEVVKYEITFRYDNGENDKTVLVEQGKTVERPQDPEKEGYIFTGWYRDLTLINMWDFLNDKVDSNTTLYAGWTPEKVDPSPDPGPGTDPDEPEPPVTVQYEIVFVYGNGSPDTTVIVDEGAIVTKPSDPTRSGYTFLGWFKDTDGAEPWNFASDTATSNTTLYAGWKSNTATDKYHEDFLGLVEALLSDSNNCLNHNDLIYDAVLKTLTHNKRPEEDAPILHCSVNSISGGTMSSIAEHVNTNLTSDLQFLFEVDPDPTYRDSRLILYMYYQNDCDAASAGDEILVYKQILSRGSDDIWYADGTYIGRAVVGNYYGGGNNGKDVFTIDAYSWKAGAPET